MAFRHHHLDRFLMRAMDDIAPNYLHLLTGTDRQHILKRTDFLKRASLEEKMILLAKIGYPFAIVVAARAKRHRKEWLPRVLKVFFKKITFFRRDAAFLLKDHSFFLMADIDVIKPLQLSANLINAGLVRKIDKHELDRESQATKELDAIVLRALITADNKLEQEKFLNNYKITHKKFILLAIISKGREVTLVQIREHVGEMKIKHELFDLVREGMVHNKYTSNQLSEFSTKYWLTGYGEVVLAKARNYFLRNV